MLCLLRRHNRPFLLLIRRLHNNLGHRPPTLLTKIIREVGSNLETQEHIKSFQCRICERLTRQRPARPTTAVRRQVLGMIIATSCVSGETCSHICVLSQYRISSMKPLGFMWQTVLKAGPSRRLGNCSTVEQADALNNSCMIRSDADGMFLGQNFKRYCSAKGSNYTWQLEELVGKWLMWEDILEFSKKCSLRHCPQGKRGSGDTFAIPVYRGSQLWFIGRN